jgi:ribosome-associated heat shock protein Hsp15
LVHGASLRLDKWLLFARLSKSRGCAKALCESRRLRIDGRVVERASALVRVGQVLSFPDQGRLEGGVVIVRVECLAERRGPFCEARLMYTDLGATLPVPAMHQPETASAGAMMQQARNQPLTAPAATF